MLTIQQRVAALGDVKDRVEALETIGLLLAELETGSVRAAIRDPDGLWKVQSWVKTGIIAAIRLGTAVEFTAGPLSFVDKDTLPARRFHTRDGIRIVPGGSSVRRGAHIGRRAVLMAPSFVNIGAFVDDDSMIDSHVLVGSCAQIGKRVHLSAAAQVGGVLEPIGDLPVIIEDDVVVGGNCGIYEGTIIRSRAVIGAGVIITGSTPVYDVPRAQIYRRKGETALEIPSGAVVVPGARAINGAFAEHHRLAISTPVIIKYRDGKTDGATTLEEAVR
jgi:2,3,4,5-tetrahydropyridine-2-carboxylate N-succinyltransferase